MRSDNNEHSYTIHRMLNSMSGMDNGGAMALPLIETTTPLLVNRSKQYL